MALKPLHLQSLILLVLIAQRTHAQGHIPNRQKPSPFDIIKNLQGCHKGNKSEGLHHLKNYLQQFGYLNPNQSHANNDDFDDALDLALKTYQENYHITPTGVLDASTISRMTSPRCGNPDIVNGVNTMHKHKTSSNGEPPSTSFHTVSHYTFLNGNRWPPNKSHLTYRFLPSTPSYVMSPVARAFGKWASATQFTFSQVRSNKRSDLSIGFFSGDHGDGYPFDGRSGTLAHAFAPQDGRFHYDADERWANGAVQNAFDLETVALHEIGHLLGLGHSSVQNAIMFPGIAAGVSKGLHADDIQGIRALYNV